MALYNVVIGYSLANERKGANTYQVVTDLTPQSAATFCHDIWDDEIMPLLTNDVIHTETKASTFDSTGFGFQTGTQTGSIALDPLTPNTCYLVRKNLENRSRGGRWFLPGCDEGNVDGKGNVSGPKVTAINTALGDWLVAMNAAAMEPVFGKVIGVTDNVWSITSLTADPLVATQRRRLR